MTKGVDYMEETMGWVSILAGFDIVQVTTFIYSPPMFLWEGEIMAGPEFVGGITFIINDDLFGYT